MGSLASFVPFSFIAKALVLPWHRLGVCWFSRGWWFGEKWWRKERSRESRDPFSVSELPKQAMPARQTLPNLAAAFLPSKHSNANICGRAAQIQTAGAFWEDDSVDVMCFSHNFLGQERKQLGKLQAKVVI